MTTDTITTDQVSQWMHEQLEKAHELSGYAAISVCINQQKAYADIAKVRYSLFIGAEYGPGIEKPTMEECFAVVSKFTKDTPQSRAAKLRADAAALLDEAERLETQA